jgi:hypothetical protein
VARLHPARTDAGIRAVKEEQPLHTLGCTPGDHLRHKAAHVMRHESKALRAQPVGQRQNIASQRIRRGILGGLRRRLLRIAKAPKIRRNQVKPAHQPRHDRPPDVRPLWPAVQQEQWHARAAAQVVRAVVVDVGEVGVDGGHF